MNSDQERDILEGWGWTYDYVARKWVAPDGYEITTDDLMLGAQVLGPGVEDRLRELARAHGRETEGGGLTAGPGG